jgi:hypothetical protein
MTRQTWSRAVAAVALTLSFGTAQLQAVELANIDAVGAGTGTPATPSIPAGESTPNFFVETSTVVGVYPIRIGEFAADDFYGGVLLASARENGGRTDGLGVPFWPLPGITSTPASGAEDPDGTLSIYVRSRIDAATNQRVNSNVAAAYFPYSEGWVGGSLRNTANGGNANDTTSLNGVDLTTIQANFNGIENGVSRVIIPGLTDTRQQGLLFANHSKDEDNYASVAPSHDGSSFVVTVSNGGNAMTPESDPYAFVYIPHGTANVTMGSIHGASGPNQTPTVLSQTGNFTIVREGAGTYRLSIPGQSPTTGVLLTNSGGQMSGGGSSTSDNALTYQADGNTWIIQTREWGQGSGTAGVIPPSLETPTADRSQAFQFAFMPFNAPPTAPGPNVAPATNLKDKIIGFNLQETEVDGTQQANPNNYGTITGGTDGYNFQHLRQDRGDNSVAVNGFFPAATDGIFFATVNQGFRDNTTTLGEAAWGMIAAGDNGGGWEFHTHVADPGAAVASSVEFNVNFSAVMFGVDTPFQKAHNVAQVQIPDQPDPALRNLVVSVPGETTTSGVLIAQAFGNNDDYAVITPAVDGQTWTVETYDNNTGVSNNNVNWIFFPYTTQNLVAGRVDANGSILDSTNPAGFTLTKEATGSYLLTIPGTTPADGTLLLTATETTGLLDNQLVYEAAGNSFRILGVDQVTFEEKSAFIFPSLEDTSFSFAFIDHDTPPVLEPGDFLAADFDEDGAVDGDDLTTWRNGFGTGTQKGQGDADADGDVDGSDFLVWQQQVGTTPAAAVASAIPEPASMALAGLSVVALAALRRRQS